MLVNLHFILVSISFELKFFTLIALIIMLLDMNSSLLELDDIDFRFDSKDFGNILLMIVVTLLEELVEVRPLELIFTIRQVIE